MLVCVGLVQVYQVYSQTLYNYCLLYYTPTMLVHLLSVQFETLNNLFPYIIYVNHYQFQITGLHLAGYFSDCWTFSQAVT